MGSRQVRQRHSVMRLIGEIKLLLNDEDSLYSPDCLEGVFSETRTHLVVYLCVRISPIVYGLPNIT
jgi:hypothetical protein